MSAYTNGLVFWKHFEKKQDAIFNYLKSEQYEELNDITWSQIVSNDN